MPDLGLGYLATALRTAGHEVYIKDWSMGDSIGEYVEWLQTKVPAVVGIKIFTKDVKPAQKTMDLIRKILPDAVLIIGGPHPSSCEASQLLEDFPQIDYAIRGEAELSLAKLLDAIASVERTRTGETPIPGLELIPGLIWTNNKLPVVNPIKLASDLDSLGLPSWDLINPNLYRVEMFGSTDTDGPVAPILATRGCPGQCSFCCAFTVSGRKIRYRTPANILDEISLLYTQYNIRKFMFTDNCFTSNRNHLRKLCQSIIHSTMNIEWDCVSYERLESLDAETLRLMAKAGCKMIHLGIESASNNVRKTMNKACQLSQVDEKIALIKNSGIKVCGWFMIGFPEETISEIFATIKYAFFAGLDKITFTILYPLPSSEAYNYLKKKYGISRLDWPSYNNSCSPYPLSRLASRKLNILLKAIRLALRAREKFRIEASNLPVKQ